MQYNLYRETGNPHPLYDFSELKWYIKQNPHLNEINLTDARGIISDPDTIPSKLSVFLEHFRLALNKAGFTDI